MLWGNTRYIGCGKRTYPQKPRRYRRDIEKLPELNITKIMEIKEQLNSMTNRQKRDVMDQLSPVFHINDTDVENKSRQARRIDYYNNHQFNYRHYQPSYDSEMEKFRQEIAAYNRSIHEYFQKYQKELSQAGDYKKQIKFYQDYLKKLEQISNGGDAYDFQSLLQQYEIFKQVHERQQYHDQKLKQKLANQKKLNPVISKYYSFSPSKPVIAGIEYEYYVCNYGPSGNYPDSRMYTQGYSRCNYYGLCQGNALKLCDKNIFNNIY